MLQKTDRMIVTAHAHRPPPIVRRIDAIAVALPLKSPMKMAGITITRAENLIVRVESTDGGVGWGEAPSAPTMTGDTLGGLVAGGGVGAAWPARHWTRVTWAALTPEGRARPNER